MYYNKPMSTRLYTLLIFIVLSTTAYAQGHYTGSYANGKKNGQGTYVWDNGDKYVGNWVNDSICGQGTYYWHTGEVYVGEWHNDKKHGQGKMTWPDGLIYEGKWVNDDFRGELPKIQVQAQANASVKPQYKVQVSSVTDSDEVVAKSNIGVLSETVDAPYAIKGKGRAQTQVTTIYKIRQLDDGSISYLFPAKQLAHTPVGFKYLAWCEIRRNLMDRQDLDVLKIGLGAIGNRSLVQSMCRRHSHSTKKIYLTLSDGTKLEAEAKLRDARPSAMKQTRDKAQYTAEVVIRHLVYKGSKNTRTNYLNEKKIIRLLSMYDIVSINMHGHEIDLTGAGYSKLINEVYNNR